MAKKDSSVKVVLGVAEAEFERFAASWDLDTDTASMEEEDRKSFEDLQRKLVRKIVSGSLAIGDDGCATYTLMHPKSDVLTEVTFSVPTGAAVVGWDKYKDRQNVHKLNAFMGACTKQAPATFAAMDFRDLKVCQAVALLFLAS
ncbi:MAG: hypothetical protein V3W41_14470 [Planctomycetota bacterium]